MQPDSMLTLSVTAVLSDLDSTDDDERFFGSGAIAGAMRAHASAVEPRSLTFLAEIVRRDGLAHALRLPDPTPTTAQSELLRYWLAAAAEGAERDGDQAWRDGYWGVARDDRLARWLDTVAMVLAVILTVEAGQPASEQRSIELSTGCRRQKLIMMDGC